MNQETSNPETPWTGPIFVCGPSRSGTALVRSILNGHSRVHLAGETHYMDDLRARLGEFATKVVPLERRRECEDYFLALGHRPYSHGGDPEKGRVKRNDLVELVCDLGGSGDAYLEAFCRLEAKHEHAEIWGEKTPRHIFRIGEMLEAFPRAKVICLLRDPRAVVASYRDWKNQGGFDFEADPGHKETLEADHRRAKKSYHPIIISLLWKGAMQAALSAGRRFGEERVRLVKYEDLASNADGAIPSLAEWAGLDFQESMAEVPMHNSSYNKFEKVSGVSSAPINRWREKLTPGEIAAVESVCAPVMRELNYDLIRPKGRRLSAARYWATMPFASVRAAAVNRKRIANLPAYVLRRLQLTAGK